MSEMIPVLEDSPYNVWVTTLKFAIDWGCTGPPEFHTKLPREMTGCSNAKPKV